MSSVHQPATGMAAGVRQVGERLRGRDGLLVLLHACYVLLFVAAVAIGWTGVEHQTVIADLAFVPPTIITIVLAMWTARSVPGRNVVRWAWIGIALSGVVLCIADVLKAFNETAGVYDFPTWADAGYLSFYPTMLASLLMFSLTLRRGTYRVTFWLDAAMVVPIGMAALWYFAFEPILASTQPDLRTTLTVLAYPAGDFVLLLGLTAMSVGRAKEPDVGSIRLLALAILVWICGDIAYGGLVLQGAYKGGDPIDCAWMISGLLTSLAAQARLREAGRVHLEPTGDQAVQRTPTVPLLPYAVALIGSGLLLVTERGGWTNPQFMIDVAIVVSTAMVISRQMLVMRDNVQLQKHLRQLAYRDPLTGLSNRAHFLERTREAVMRARTDGALLAVLFVDVDDFKIINDSLGHGAGDQLLCTIAERLQGCVGDKHLVARLGGDEFTILLEDVQHPDDADAMAHRLVSELQRPLLAAGRDLAVGASMGVALSDSLTLGSGLSADADVQNLLRAADLALYAAKASGKGQARRFEPAMAEQALNRLELESELRQALDQGAFEVHYQPLVSFATGAVQEVEALVRWSHPVRGTIGPAAFISIAEDTGLIVPLGRWVLETACRDVRRWQVEFPSGTPLRVSVNLSARQLQDPNLVDDVRRILDDTGLDPATLKLEITESVALANTTLNRSTLASLRQLGIRLAVDDFGTGNAAMEYLRHFPVDTLKIDRSFVEDIGRDERATALVRGMIAFARSVGLEVTGEGIETLEQSAQLRAMGCELGQGFLFARPLPASQLETCLLQDAFKPVDATPFRLAA